MPDYGTARADFPGGDAGLLYRSIRRILELPADTRLFTCHDYKAAGRDRTLLWVARSKFYYRPRPESAEKTRVAMAALSGEKTPAEPPNTGTYTADGCRLQMRLAAYRTGSVGGGTHRLSAPGSAECPRPVLDQHHDGGEPVALLAHRALERRVFEPLE
jgi:hypothetical protein